MYTPKMINTSPEIGFKIETSTTEVIKLPRTIAIPSTIKNARITPKKMELYFFVRDESNRTETCVLSPSSAIAIATKGTRISSKMALTVPLVYRIGRILLEGKYLLVSLEKMIWAAGVSLRIISSFLVNQEAKTLITIEEIPS